MMIVAMLLAGAQVAAVPSPAAVALGERLARAGTLAALLPMMAAKDVEELVAAHPELDAADRAALRRSAAATQARLAAKALAAEGRRYAELLSADELATLVAAAESPAARHLRAVTPQAIAAVMGAMPGVDGKQAVMAAFCRETGKGCATKAP